MAEALYAALASLAILLLLRAEVDGSSRSVVLAAAATIAAYYTRTAGIALVLGGALALASRRRWGHCGIFLALCYGLALLPWKLWQAQQAPVPLTESYYNSLSYRQFNIVSAFTIPQKLSILRQNIRFLADDITYTVCTPLRYSSWLYIPFCAAVAAGFHRLRHYRAFVIPAVMSIVMPVLWAETAAVHHSLVGFSCDRSGCGRAISAPVVGAGRPCRSSLNYPRRSDCRQRARTRS